MNNINPNWFKQQPNQFKKDKKTNINYLSKASISFLILIIITFLLSILDYSLINTTNIESYLSGINLLVPLLLLTRAVFILYIYKHLTIEKKEKLNFKLVFLLVLFTEIYFIYLILKKRQNESLKRFTTTIVLKNTKFKILFMLFYFIYFLTIYFLNGKLGHSYYDNREKSLIFLAVILPLFYFSFLRFSKTLIHYKWLNITWNITLFTAWIYKYDLFKNTIMNNTWIFILVGFIPTIYYIILKDIEDSKN